MRPASISERIKADCAQHKSAFYRKNQALKHLPPINTPEDTVFDHTPFGQRNLLLETDWVEAPHEEEPEELHGVLDL